MVEVEFKIDLQDGSIVFKHATFDTLPGFAVGDVIELDGALFWVHTKVWVVRTSTERNDTIRRVVVEVEEVDDARNR